VGSTATFAPRKTKLPSIGSAKPFRTSWAVLPFVLVHLACVAVFFVPFHWGYVALALALYYVRMFFVTAGYHRYFSHRSFKTSRIFQFILAVGAMTSVQKGVLWWAAHHRRHHRYSDQDEDVHSPQRDGFFWAHVGWIMSSDHNQTEMTWVADFAKFPELVWLNRYHVIPPIVFATSIYLLGGWSALVWGFVVSTVMLWHGTFFINSLAHVFGRRRYATTDTSKNSLLLSLLTLGEGWHNNHHYYMASVRQGFFWWEIDITYYILRALSWFGIVRELKTPPPTILYANRIAA
jgi:stearoyl-CoA desaturase (delta-9 desaturase)